MTSEAALASLKLSADAWNDYLADAAPAIDLAGADLSGLDLRGRRLLNCKLSGTDLSHSNLDSASFIGCDLSGTRMYNVSLVTSAFRDVNSTELNLSRAVIRNAGFDNCAVASLDITDAELSACSLKACEIGSLLLGGSTCTDVTAENCNLNCLSGSRLDMRGCTFTDSSIRQVTLDASSIAACNFRACRLQDWKLAGGTFESCQLHHSEIHCLSTEGCDVQQLDLSGSYVARSKVEELDPRTAILLETAFVNCLWPSQTGRVTITGRYIANPHLLQQPVQDLKGVPPDVRRDVADAQYLVRRSQRAGGLVSRLGFRMWGAVTAYGQSVSRLTVWILVVITIHTLGLLWSTGNLVGGSFSWKVLSHALGLTAGYVIGLTQSLPTHSTSRSTNYVLVSARVAGLAVAGLWISVASRKLSQLAGA